MDLAKIIRNVKDFPEEGILFRDITTVLQDGEAFCKSVDQMRDMLEGVDFNIIVGPESRGFIFGTPIAYLEKKGFVPVRKKGKLPYETISKEYSLEYGTATIEVHKDAIKKGDKVVVVDDLLATGGTCKAIVELIEELGGEITCLAFLIELEELKGRDVLCGYNVKSLLKY